MRTLWTKEQTCDCTIPQLPGLWKLIVRNGMFLNLRALQILLVPGL